MTAIIPHERIDKLILLIRGEKMILDADLAMLYGVTTKRLNERVKRNKDRFPDDFMFQLTKTEKDEVVANCDHLRKLKYSPNLPYAFTEHGTIMLANLLNSRTAIQASVHIVRSFVRLRMILSSHKELTRKIDAMEKKYDNQFKIVFDAIRQMMATPKTKSKKIIGFGEGKQ